MLKCNPAGLVFGSTLPRRLHTLVICSGDEYGSPNVRSLPQLSVALRGLPALERFVLNGQDLQEHLAPILAALQHSTLLTHLEFHYCGLTGLPEG